MGTLIKTPRDISVQQAEFIACMQTQCELMAHYYSCRVEQITLAQAQHWISIFAPDFREIWDEWVHTSDLLETILYS